MEFVLDPEKLWMVILNGVCYHLTNRPTYTDVNAKHLVTQRNYTLGGTIDDWAAVINKCDDIITNKSIKHVQLKQWLLADIRPFLLELYFAFEGQQGDDVVLNQMLYNDGENKLRGWLLNFYPNFLYYNK